MTFAALSALAAVAVMAAEERPSIKLQTDTLVPAVRVAHSDVASACAALAHKLGRNGHTRVILTPSRPQTPGHEPGSEWTATMNSVTTVKVADSDLPPVLRKLKGHAAESVTEIACYLVDSAYTSTRELVIVAKSPDDARIIAKALK